MMQGHQEAASPFTSVALKLGGSGAGGCGGVVAATRAVVAVALAAVVSAVASAVALVVTVVVMVVPCCSHQSRLSCHWNDRANLREKSRIRAARKVSAHPELLNPELLPVAFSCRIGHRECGEGSSINGF